MSWFGLFSKDTSIPLRSVSVNAAIKGYLVGIETQVIYSNEYKYPLEVQFRFPVDEGMAVVRLEATIAGKTIKGKVQEKEKARVTYDDAIASGLTAALGEEKKGDIFRLALGNLPPGEDAKLHLTLVGELPLQADPPAVVFTLPTLLKPRYVPVGSSDPLAPVNTGEGTQVAKGSIGFSDFRLKVFRPSSVDSISSPTHAITTTEDEGVFNVSLSERKVIDEDLVVHVAYKEPHTARVVIEEGKPVTNDLMANPVVMLDFFPKFTSPQAACEFVFLVDRSGSMSGSFIKSARETLLLFLKSIPPGCFFNIIGFGTNYECLFRESVPYNQTNLDKALQHAEGMKADLGGTELLEPLTYIFQQNLLSGLSRQVFVLTDGSVSNTEACIDIAKKNDSVARVFTFGIGSGASTTLVKGLARAGNGSAEFIHVGERMQPKVISSLKKALQPSVSNLQLHFDVPFGIHVQQAPSKIPPIFNGERIIMYAILKAGACINGKCTATLSGIMLGSKFEHKMEFDISTNTIASSSCGSYFTSIIHQLAAKRLIQDWQDGNGPDWSKDERKLAIIKMSVDSGVVSSFTAYVAIHEEQNQVIEGALKIWDLTAMGGALVDSDSDSMSNCSSDDYEEEDDESGPSIVHRKVFGPVLYRSVNKSLNNESYSDEEYLEEHALVCTIEPEDKENEMSYDGVLLKAPSMISRSGDTTDYSLLSKLIGLQTAEGFWKLSDELANIVGIPQSELQNACPNKEYILEVWGTVLALLYLEKRFNKQKDEWELVAAKGQMWLSSFVGNSASVSVLKEAASKYIF